MYRAVWQGTIIPQKSKVCWASADNWPRMALLSSLTARNLRSSNSSFCQVPFPPPSPPHTHLPLLSSLSLCLGLPHLKHAPSPKLFNPHDCQHSQQGQLSIFYSQKAQPKVTDGRILSKPPSSKGAHVKLDLCPSRNQVSLDNEGYSWVLFGLPTKR